MKAQFAKHAQDFDDLQNEMAGRDVGRIERFLTADTREDKINSKRGTRKDADLTNLQILLMNDLAYAALYRQTTERLNEAQTRLDTALETVQRARKEAEERLEDKLSADQRAVEEARLTALAELEADILAGQAEVGDMQLRMQDEDNPVQSDELERFKERTDEIEARILPRVEALTASASSAPAEDAKPSFATVEIDIPKL